MWEKEGIVVLVALSAANLFTYITRYIPSATKDLIKEDLGLTDMQTGLIFTVFICCYMVVSPFIGIVADHKWVKRKVLIVAGMLLLSLATFLTGLCHSFTLILLPRILFGMGESIFCTISPTFLSDFFDPGQRNIVMSLFFGAIPIGCALGYTIAGTLGQACGWQRAFEYLAIPGLLSLGLLFLREPEMGERDRVAALASAKERARLEEQQNTAAALVAEATTNTTTATTTTTTATSADAAGSMNSTSRTTATSAGASASATRRNEEQPLLRASEGQSGEAGSTRILNGQFVVSVLGYVAETFGMGGFSDWLPTFFTRYHGMSMTVAGLVNGGIVVVGGLCGTLLGGFAGELTQKYVTDRHPLLLFSGLTMLVAATAGTLALVVLQDKLLFVEIMLGCAVFFGWCYNGPINSVVLNSVVSRLRSRANGVCTLLIHLFGDAISPSIIGLVSDRTDDLRSSLLIVPMSLLVAAIIWIGGFLTLPSPAPFFKCLCCRRPKRTAAGYTAILPVDTPDTVVTGSASPSLPVHTEAGATTTAAALPVQQSANMSLPTLPVDPMDPEVHSDSSESGGGNGSDNEASHPLPDFSYHE